MSEYLIRLYEKLKHHQRLTLLGMVVVTILFVVLASTIHYEEDIAKFLPRNAQNEKFQNIYDQISSQNKIAVIFSSRDTLNRVSDDSLEMAMEDLGQRLRDAHIGKNLQVTIDEKNVQDMMDFVYRNVPYFLKAEDYHRMDSLLSSPDYVKEQMTENRKMLMMPMAGMMIQSLKYDPLHLYTPVLKRLQHFNVSDNYQMADGYLFTKDGKHSLISFESPYGSSETYKNSALASQLDTLMAHTEKEYPTVKVSAVGAPLIAVTNANQIKKDSLLSVALAVVVILFLLIWHYRRISDILWIGVSLTFGFLFALAGMAVFKDSVSIIVLGIGSVIIGIAVNYPLHFLDHIREVTNRKEALREIAPPLLIGNITTVAAFFCLVWLDAQAMRDLGLFGSLMLIGTILFVLVFLPVYAKSAKMETRPIIPPQIRIPRIPYLLPAVLVITLILGYFSLQTSFDSNLSNINYMTVDQKENMQMMTSSMKKNPLYVIADGKTMDDAVDKNEKLYQQLMASGKVESVNGVSDFLVSKEEQKHRIALWNRFVGKYHALLHDELLAQSRQSGFSSSAFAPYIEILQKDYHPQPLSHFNMLTSKLGGSFILQDSSAVHIINYVYAKDEAQVRKLVPQAFNGKDIGNQLVEVLNDSFNYIGYVCGFVVFFFLWFSFGSIELASMSFLPLAVSWIWILGIMHLLGIQFNIVNIILATFIFGQGDDYTIFITEGLMYEYSTGKKRLASYKNSVMFSAILMFIGIGCLVFAKHPALRSLGAVTVIGMITVVLMAYYLPPLVFHWLTMSHGIRREVPITASRLVYSLGAMLFFLAFMYIGALPYTWFYFHFGTLTEERKLKFHRLIQKVSDWMMNHIPGVSFSYDNSVGETFEKPAVIICNHQSHFDIMSLLRFSPKMVIVTNNWTWNNPFYGMVIHHAEFLPAADGVEKNLPKLQDLYRRGYSIVIFPEGTRSADCSIMRFHKGAFYLAKKLGADILPMYIHGQGHVLPKKDFMLRRGRMYVEVGERVRFQESTASNSKAEKINGIDIEENQQILEMTHHMRHQYQAHYAELCDKLETEDYWKSYREYQKIYEL